MDNFSRLPDELVLRIISLLAIKDAIRTSVLSTKWRYLYASMPNLVFRFQESVKPDAVGLTNLVNRIFYFRNRSPVDKFCLGQRGSEALDPLLIQGWIQAVLWLGIRELDLYIAANVLLPASLFACKTLEVLKVKMHYMNLKFVSDYSSMEVPAKICLPNLKVLHLVEINFSDGDSLNRLISNCHVLVELVFHSWGGDFKLSISKPTLKVLAVQYLCPEEWSGSFEIVIDSPNIVFLNYCIWGVTSHSFVNVQSLADANIYFPHNTSDHNHNAADCSHYIHAAADLMRAISNIKTLRISGPTIIVGSLTTPYSQRGTIYY